MKKIGKIKKTGIAFTALSVSAALLGGGLACSMPYNASADNVPSARAAESPIEVFTDLSVPTEADYGKSFKVKAAPSGSDVSIIAPDGTEVALGTADGGYYSIEAKQVGNYTVKYNKTGNEQAAYSFNVSVSLNEDYFLKVDNNGAGIPTRIKTGTSLPALPEAHIAYYDENKILRYYPGNVNWTITDSIGDEENPTGHTHEFGDTFEVKNSGKLYITYSAQIEDDGTKYFSETFTVNVQSSFEDKQAPSLTLSGITSNISVRRAVTLPTATVSDDFDENPLVEITVTDPNGNPVKTVDIDEYGYAYQDAAKLAEDEQYMQTDAAGDIVLNYPVVAFDNKDVMTFYPLIAGQYKIKYVAKDDAGNVSGTKSWVMTAGDSTAPVFQEIDDWKLPEKWGLTVTKANGESTETLESSAIEIPIPYLVDNKDHMRAVELEDGKEDKDLISLYVRITDSDYSRDILTFKNVLAKPAENVEEGKKAKADCNAENDVYASGDEQTFSQYAETPFKFDFSKYDRKDKDGNPVDKAGTYTVYYRASDAAGNRSTKTYTIKLESTYEDTKAPVIDDVNVPDYISIADTTFNIPSAIAKDAESSTIHIEYRIYSDNNGPDEEGGRYITVKGGEKADIEIRDVEGEEKMFLVIDSGKDYAKELELVGKMYFCITATDAVGNVALNSETATGAYDIDNYTESKDVVKIIEKSDESGYNYNGAIEFKTATVDAEGNVTGWAASSSILEGQEVNAGGFTIDVTDVDMRKYTGFEISVVNENGTPLLNKLETYTTYDDSSAKIYVQNIRFTPSKEGVYYLTVRVFNVNNVNSVYSYSFTVGKSTTSGGDIRPSAVVVPESNGSINVKYTLHEADSLAGAESGHVYYHAHKIAGKVYSLMGNEFIAKAQGSYSFTDGFVDEASISNSLDAKFLADGVNGGQYSFSAVDSEKPVIEVQGIMPTYAEKSTEEKQVLVEIPSIIAYSENGAANVKVEVTYKGDPVKTEKVEGTNKYTFEGKNDGVYTIRVIATRADAGKAEATYTVNVGDVVPPEFTVTGGTSGRKAPGDTFTYGKIKLVDESEKGTVQITKKIYDPSGAEVSGSTVSGTYNSYKDKTNNGSTIKLDKSGTYKVVYTVKDSVGNEEPYIEYVVVSASGTSTPTTFTTLSTVLIIIAVVLLAGVIIYVVRFRKVKK